MLGSAEPISLESPHKGAAFGIFHPNVVVLVIARAFHYCPTVMYVGVVSLILVPTERIWDDVWAHYVTAAGKVYHFTELHVGRTLDHYMHGPNVATGVGTYGITCSLGSAEPSNLKCATSWPKMTYTTGVGSKGPKSCKNANLHPYFIICKKPPIIPFFAKTIGGTMGLLRYNKKMLLPPANQPHREVAPSNEPLNGSAIIH